MIAYSYFNIKDIERERWVYRIIPIRLFQNILITKQFGFVNPAKWGDPYENFLLNQTFKTKNGYERSFKELTKSLYGSCWTFNSNTDYGWKVYLKDEMGVQIKTKFSHIYKHFEYLKNDQNVQTFQIGKVRYSRWKKLKELYESQKKINILTFLMDTSSFEKRYEYKHEKEVRILLRYLNHTQNLLLLDFDINELSKSIMLDPRLSYKDFLLEKEKIKRLGFKGRIYRSLLYTAPKLDIKYENIE